MHRRIQVTVVPLVLAATLTGPVVSGQVEAPAQADPAAARAEFDAASDEMKRIVGEAAVLQAKWHQPNADKAALEKKFETLETEGRAAGKRLEAAAIALVQVSPKDREARKICGAAVAAALRSDEPQRALDTATTVAK